MRTYEELNPVVLKERIGRRIIEMGAVQFGEFTLASGKKSDVYINLKLAITDPEFLGLCGQAMVLYSPEVDKVAGVALGAVPLAVVFSLEADIPYLMVRKEAKGHGTRSLIEGALERGDRIVMVEDVTTTAGSAIRGIEAIREMGGLLDTLVVIVDRCEGATENLAVIGVRLIPILTLDELRAMA